MGRNDGVLMMEIFIKFITYCAWFFGVVSLISIMINGLLRFHYNSEEGKLQRGLDLLAGYQKTYPIQRYLIILFLSIIWLLASK